MSRFSWVDVLGKCNDLVLAVGVFGCRVDLLGFVGRLGLVVW